MQARSLGILLASVLAFGAFIWFFERDLPSSDERTELGTRLFAIEAAEVVAAEITVGEDRVAFGRFEDADGVQGEASDWRLTRPLQSPAENFRVDGLVRTIVDMRSSRSLTVEDPETYGLATPRGEVTLRLRNGDRLTVEVGSEVPASSNMYVRLAGDSEVHVTENLLWSDLTRPVGEWRRAAMFPGVSGDIDSFRITGPEGTVELVRDEDGFRLAEPVSDRAAMSAVDSLVRAIAGLRATGFVDDSPDVVALGLDPPGAQVEVGLGDDESLLLEWGAELEAGGGHYARIGEVIFETNADLDPVFARGAQEWRSSAWTTIAGFEVEGVRVDDQQATSTLARENGAWTHDGETIEFSLVNRLLDVVTDAVADRVLPEPPEDLGLGEPLVVVTLTTRSGSTETLRLYASDAHAGAIATTEGRDAALVMAPDLVTELATRIAAVREAEAQPEPENGTRTE